MLLRIAACGYQRPLVTAAEQRQQQRGGQQPCHKLPHQDRLATRRALQETLAALSDSIDRYDPSRGARFSTWLLSIAKHALGDEIGNRTGVQRLVERVATFDDNASFLAQVANDSSFDA